MILSNSVLSFVSRGKDTQDQDNIFPRRRYAQEEESHSRSAKKVMEMIREDQIEDNSVISRGYGDSNRHATDLYIPVVKTHRRKSGCCPCLWRTRVTKVRRTPDGMHRQVLFLNSPNAPDPPAVKEVFLLAKEDTPKSTGDQARPSASSNSSNDEGNRSEPRSRSPSDHAASKSQAPSEHKVPLQGVHSEPLASKSQGTLETLGHHEAFKGQLGQCGNEVIKQQYPKYCNEPPPDKKAWRDSAAIVHKEGYGGQDDCTTVDRMNEMLEECAQIEDQRVHNGAPSRDPGRVECPIHGRAERAPQRGHNVRSKEAHRSSPKKNQRGRDSYEMVGDLFQTLADWVQQHKDRTPNQKSNGVSTQEDEPLPGTEEKPYYNIEMHRMRCGKERIVINKC